MKKRFDMVEEDGVVIYDESDDYDPGEETLGYDVSEEGDFRLMTNEEIFTDEYMRNFAKKMDEEIARERCRQRLISVGVITAIILFIGAVTYINFKNIL